MKFIGYLRYYIRIKDEYENIRYYYANEEITCPISADEILDNQQCIYETVYDCKVLEIDFVSEKEYMRRNEYV